MKVYKELVQRIKIFISSPSDVAAEREVVLRVIEKLNRLTHIKEKYVLTPLIYEKDVPPEVGDIAQVIVDRHMAIQQCYMVICILWSKMGTPFTHPVDNKYFESGTAYEFEMAYNLKHKEGNPNILLYRCTRPFPINTDPTQISRINRFFDKFKGNSSKFKGLYGTYTDINEFYEKVFEHIENIRKCSRGIKISSAPTMLNLVCAL